MAKHSISDMVSDRPIVDHIVPLAALAVWWFFFQGWTPEDSAARQWIYATLATVAGLVLTASTFACTMTYQATDAMMVKIRRAKAGVLKKNWFSILQASLLSAALPIFCLALDGTSVELTGAIVVYMAPLLILRFRRALAMLALVLFVSENSRHLGSVEPSAFVIPSHKRSS